MRRSPTAAQAPHRLPRRIGARAHRGQLAARLHDRDDRPFVEQQAGSRRRPPHLWLDLLRPGDAAVVLGRIALAGTSPAPAAAAATADRRRRPARAPRALFAAAVAAIVVRALWLPLERGSTVATCRRSAVVARPRRGERLDSRAITLAPTGSRTTGLRSELKQTFTKDGQTSPCTSPTISNQSKGPSWSPRPMSWSRWKTGSGSSVARAATASMAAVRPGRRRADRRTGDGVCKSIACTGSPDTDVEPRTWRRRCRPGRSCAGAATIPR